LKLNQKFKYKIHITNSLMALEIVTPELGKVKKATKDLVISTLTFSYPLTLAKITNSIKKEFNVSVTFQGVRKAVNLLVENEVIIKEGKDYSISKAWIIKLRDYAEKLHESYFSDSKGIRRVESVGEDIKVYTFDNLIDMDKFWNKIIGKWFDDDAKRPGEKYYTQQSGHTWYVLGQLEEETSILEKIHKHNIHFYTLAVGNTPLDRWCTKYYEDQKFHYTTCKTKGNTSRYFAIYNDFVIQTEYPAQLAREIDEIYARAKDFASFEATRLIMILRKNIELKVTVMRNPVVAEQLRKYILSHFKGR
jgi:hypothetical protein